MADDPSIPWTRGLSVFLPMAEATAARLGGVAGTGVEVGSDADLARAVAAGFNVKAIDALRQSGVTGGELGTLIIKPRTLSHRRTNGGRLTVDESDRAARVARGLAVAGRTFANREKAARWLHRSVPGLALPGRPRRPQTVHAGEPGSPSVGSPFALTKNELPSSSSRTDVVGTGPAPASARVSGRLPPPVVEELSVMPFEDVGDSLAAGVVPGCSRSVSGDRN